MEQVLTLSERACGQNSEPPGGHLDEGLRGEAPDKRQARQKSSDDQGFNR
jgi:hypothetical protein